MAVFTEVTPPEAEALMQRLGLGHLRDMQGCASGIENTNYFASTERGEYVLTLFERLSFEQLPFYLHLMKHLAARGLPVPDPQADAAGEILFTLKGKPATVVTRLAGRNQLAPGTAHCAALGATLARMHVAASDYPRQQPNLRGLLWWREVVPVLVPYVGSEQADLLRDELAHQEAVSETPDYAGLPRGPVHADLFRDNVMFEGDTLTGVFDFYFAGCDTWLFDLAVALNDWCVHLASGEMDTVRARALVASYDAQRPLTDAELRLLPHMLRAAAMRFWCSRLWDWHLPRTAALLQPHDPRHFERVLVQRRAHPWTHARA